MRAAPPTTFTLRLPSIRELAELERRRWPALELELQRSGAPLGMPIVESDIEYRLSGGAANTDPKLALGGAMSTVAGGIITSGGMNNVFDDVSGTESKAGDIEYRGIYVKNKHASLTLQNAVVWIKLDANSPDDATAIALADEAVGSPMETIENESTAPVGPSFTAPNEGSPLSIGNIAAESYKGIWIRRTISAEADAQNEVKLEIEVAGDTAE